MAGKAGKSGRRKREVEVKGVYLRIPPALLKRVEHCHGLLQRQHGPKTTQNTAFEHILAAGCDALEGSLEGREAPAHMSISEISEISGDDVSVPGYGFPEDEDETLAPASHTNGTRAPALAVAMPQASKTPTAKTPARHGLPREKLQDIADEYTLCEGLSYSEFAQRLHDKGIYSATAKDGSKGPANRGNVKKWLDQAREAGLL